MPKDITRALERKRAREENYVKRAMGKAKTEYVLIAQHHAQEAVAKALGTYELPSYH